MDSPGAPAQPRPRRRRLLRWVGTSFACIVLVLVAFSIWIEHRCVYEPPRVPADDPAMKLVARDESPSLRRCGPAWLAKDDGIQDLYLEGAPMARGRQMAELCRESLEEEEIEMRTQLDRALPPGIKRFLIRKGALFAFRDLQRYVQPDEELELAGALPTTLSMEPGPMSDFAPAYHRMLAYQSMYDVGQAMAEAGLVDSEVGCTSFAASGRATSSGGLVLARNCDFEAGRVFDRRKVVYFVRPDQGQRCVTVSWAGIVGAVSGVNESGLVVMLHAARTERTKWPHVGRPVPMILAAALREDSTIEEVAKRLRESPFHAAAIVLVAETATGRSAVIETDPDRTLVVPSEDDVTICTNHLRDPAWDGDEVVRRIRRSGSSALRFQRMQELVEGARGRIDAAAAAAFLRDRAGLHGLDIGLGNRTAISAMLVAHAVVWDGAARRLYVSRAPRGLADFVAYDVGAFLDGKTPEPSTVRVAEDTSIPALRDPGLAETIERARELLRTSDARRRSGDADGALREADEAVLLMDSAPPALLARAEALLELQRPEEARAAAALALRRQPVPGAEEDRLRAIAR